MAEKKTNPKKKTKKKNPSKLAWGAMIAGGLVGVGLIGWGVSLVVKKKSLGPTTGREAGTLSPRVSA